MAARDAYGDVMAQAVTFLVDLIWLADAERAGRPTAARLAAYNELRAALLAVLPDTACVPPAAHPAGEAPAPSHGELLVYTERVIDLLRAAMRSATPGC